MTSRPSVSVIVLNWNGGEDTLRCLASVRAEAERSRAEVEVVLVDNGSSDGSLERARAAHPEAIVLENGANLGYCEGNNRALREFLAGDRDYAILLNNDAELDAGAVDALVDALEADARAGIAGPRILEGEDPSRIWSAGGDLVVRENVGRLRGKGCADGPEFDEATTVDFVTGCVMAVRRRALEEIGLFDADYFAYLEDVDLCVRAREGGHRVLYVPNARARHRESSSTGGGYTEQRKYWMGRNSVIFLRRHGRPGQWLGFLVFAVLGLPVAWLREAGRGNAAGVRAKARGILDGLRGRKGAPA